MISRAGSFIAHSTAQHPTRDRPARVAPLRPNAPSLRQPLGCSPGKVQSMAYFADGALAACECEALSNAWLRRHTPTQGRSEECGIFVRSLDVAGQRASVWGLLSNLLGSMGSG